MFGEVGAKTSTGGEWSKKDARRANTPPLTRPHATTSHKVPSQLSPEVHGVLTSRYFFFASLVF